MKKATNTLLVLLAVIPLYAQSAPMYFSLTETIYTNERQWIKNHFSGNQVDITTQSGHTLDRSITVDITANPTFSFPSTTYFPEFVSPLGSSEPLNAAIGPDGFLYIPQKSDYPTQQRVDTVRRANPLDGTFEDFALPFSLGTGLWDISYAFGNFYIMTGRGQFIEIQSGDGLFFNGDDIFRSLTIDIPHPNNDQVIWDITFDSQGTLYLEDYNGADHISGSNNAIYKYSASTTPQTDSSNDNNIPSPAPLALMGLGLAAIRFIRKSSQDG